MVRQQHLRLIQLSFLAILQTVSNLAAGDWPMWRCDSGRTACSAEELPEALRLAWVRSFGPRQPVWDDPLNRDLMPYDRVFEPVVGGGRMFLGFNDSDKLLALDAGTGQELWRFYAGGPVRLPPVFWRDAVYFTSDDGCLYCVTAAEGSLRWKFRGAPSDRLVIGNERLISTWPARGGPVIADGVVYFTASIWPFMGTFIYALDAENGEVIWENDRTGSQFILQPHNSPAFAGIAPQGALAAAREGLLVPGGRSVPAFFERKNGDERYFHLAAQNKTGGSFVCAAGRVFFNHYRDQLCSMYDLESGLALVDKIGSQPVLSDNIYYFGGKTIKAYDAGRLQKKARWFLEGNFIDRWLAGLKLKEIRPEFLRNFFKWWIGRKSAAWRKSLIWEIEADGSRELIRSGSRLYAAGEGSVTAVDLGREPKIIWREPVKGGVERLLAADGKLFGVTLDGRIMAFVAGPVKPEAGAPGNQPRQAESSVEKLAREIIRSTGVSQGYALVCGIGDGILLEALARNSNLRLVGLEEDSSRVEAVRRCLDESGIYGGRAAVLNSSIENLDLPPYMASLIVVNGRPGPELGRLLESLRPYGGKAWIGNGGEAVTGLLKKSAGPELKLVIHSRLADQVVLSREGPLPGAAAWTHQYGNPANTVKSDDKLVKLPLGLLWFGGSSNLDVLPRHGHGPPEQVIGGRLFIEGMDCLSARDVYTGRVLWKVGLELANFGIFYDETYQDAPTSTSYNQVHLPGANARGTNFVATADRVYVIERDHCRVLDAASGETISVFRLLASQNGDPIDWTYIGVCDEYLIAGSGFIKQSDTLSSGNETDQSPEGDKDGQKDPFLNFDYSASRSLYVLDRQNGKLIWSRQSNYGILHNSIAAGGGRLFCLDKLPPYLEAQIQRRGGKPPADYRLEALDIASGKLLWEHREGVFGSRLAFSREQGILLQSTGPSPDMVEGEDGKRMAAYSAASGNLIWDRQFEYSSVPILHNGKIITSGKLFSLLTGGPILQNHPLTGELVPVIWKRNYGCNYPIASEHLLTFRSAAAGFYDLDRFGGTGNMGGFKSGCTSNLVAADGVLNAPDYTRTCSCSYQNQTSLAMLYEPEAEYWTFNDIERGSDPIRRVGINFGAPGDRIADNGTLWLDYPSRGGPSPEIQVTVTGDNLRWFCHHSSKIIGEGPRWVAASGVEGVRQISVRLADKPTGERPYRVSLVFPIRGASARGKSPFDVYIQGNKVLENLDLGDDSLGPGTRVLVKEIERVMADQELRLEVVPALNGASPATVICGLEIAALGW